MSVNSTREDEALSNVPKRVTLLRLYRSLLSYKKPLAAVGVLLALTLAIQLASPLLIERAVDVHVANRNVPGLLRLGVLALCMYAVYTLCTKAWMKKIADVTNRVLLNIRSQLYAHIQTLSCQFLASMMQATPVTVSRSGISFVTLSDRMSFKEFTSPTTLARILPVGRLSKNWKLRV